MNHPNYMNNTKKYSGVLLENEILLGDSLELLASLPDRSVDMVFADPPYNLQLSGELRRPNDSRVDGVEEDWDKFDGFNAYDQFTWKWLDECRRVLKDDGTLKYKDGDNNCTLCKTWCCMNNPNGDPKLCVLFNKNLKIDHAQPRGRATASGRQVVQEGQAGRRVTIRHHHGLPARRIVSKDGTSCWTPDQPAQRLICHWQ